MNKTVLKQIFFAVTLLMFFIHPVFCQSNLNSHKKPTDSINEKLSVPEVKTQDCLLWEEDLNGKVKYVRKTKQEFLMDTLVKLQKERGIENWIDSMFVAPRCAVEEKLFDSCSNITHKCRLTKEGDTLSFERYFYDTTGNLIRREQQYENNRISISEYSLPLLDKKGNYYVNVIRSSPNGKIDTIKLSKNDIFKRVFYPDSIQELLKKDSVNVSFEVKQGKHRGIKYNISKNQDRIITQEIHMNDGQLERSVQIFTCGSISIKNLIYVNHKNKTQLKNIRSESKFDEYRNEIEFVLWTGDILEIKIIREIEYYD